MVKREKQNTKILLNKLIKGLIYISRKNYVLVRRTFSHDHSEPKFSFLLTQIVNIFSKQTWNKIFHI